MTAMSVMRLIPQPPGEIVRGEIIFENEDLLKKSPEAMRRIRGNDIAMIFQEPMTALNPLFTVGDQISEVYREHMGMERSPAWKSTVEILGKVGIPRAGAKIPPVHPRDERGHAPKGHDRHGPGLRAQTAHCR